MGPTQTRRTTPDQLRKDFAGALPELVRDITRELGLVPCQPRPWRPTTTQVGEGVEAVPDLVSRDFSADAPGTKMVGDITLSADLAGFRVSGYSHRLLY